MESILKMYVVKDKKDKRLYFKGYTTIGSREYPSYTALKDNALKIKNESEAQIIANNINGEVINLK